MTRAAAAALEAMFEHIACTRMAGVPLLQPGLRVQAVGFEPQPAEPAVALGVLITPWFMNLVRLPLDDAARAAMAGPAQRVRRDVGGAMIDFLGTDEAPVGRFECCSLFSPMQAFREHDDALAVARAVLQDLRQAAQEAPQRAARRAFLFGRTRSTSG